MNTAEWQELAIEKRLKYKDKDKVFGMYRDFPVLIGNNSDSEGSYVYYFLKFPEIKDENIIKNTTEDIKKYLKDNKKDVKNIILLELKSNYVIYLERYSFLGIKPEKVKEDMNSLINITSKFIRPFQESICENCNNAEVSAPVLVNDSSVSLLCDSCMKKIEYESDNIDRQYESMPVNYHQGIIFAVVAALIGSVVWAGLAFYLKRIFAILAIGIGWFVGWAMIKGAGKTSKTVQAVSSVLTVLSVIFGEILFYYFIIHEGDSSITLLQVISNFHTIIIKTGTYWNVIISVVFSLIGVIYTVGVTSKPRIKVKFEK
jgi:hypothetical protein